MDAKSQHEAPMAGVLLIPPPTAPPASRAAGATLAPAAVAAPAAADALRPPASPPIAATRRTAPPAVGERGAYASPYTPLCGWAGGDSSAGMASGVCEGGRGSGLGV